MNRGFWFPKATTPPPPAPPAPPLPPSLRLTAEEREAMETAIATLDAYRYPTLPAAAATLRTLLERIK